MNYSAVTDLSGSFQKSKSDMVGDIKVESRKGSSSELSKYASSTETSSTETSSTETSSTDSSSKDSESESENMGMGMDINSSHTLSTQSNPVEKADSYFEERDKRPGSRRWMSLLHRNLAANPGSTQHVF